jgi:hypothetical protein
VKLKDEPVGFNQLNKFSHTSENVENNELFESRVCGAGLNSSLASTCFSDWADYLIAFFEMWGIEWSFLNPYYQA